MSRDTFSFDSRDERDAAARRDNNGRDSQSPSNPQRVEQPATRAEPLLSLDRSDRTGRMPEALDSPRAQHVGDRTYFLRDSELQTLAEVGTFRVIAAPDLARASYGGDGARMEREVRRLKQQSLLSEKSIAGGRNGTYRLLTLTKQASRVLRTSGRVPAEQAIYHGFVKLREARHDADLYRLYQAQIERIEAAGGHPTRVVLDYELKRSLNRGLAVLHEAGRSPQALEQIAERYALAVVNGKIPVPDLRVEYDTADMERTHVDLELATRNYRPGALAAKAKAGFSLYARSEDTSRLRRVLDEREITTQILSL